MAKRGTLGHPKCKRLGRALGMEAWAALGLLEAFWHWVGRYRPTGQLSAEDMLDAADEVGFRDAERLAELLVTTGWLDQLDDDSYYVHDWHDHADDTVKKTLAKRKEQFANGQSARKTTIANDTKPEQIDEQESFANHSRTVRESFATSQSLSQSLSLSHEPEGVQGENAITCSEPAEPSWFDQDVGDGGQTYEAGLVRQIRAARGYGGFDPPRDRWEDMLAWMRGFAPGDDAISNLVDSFCERADQRRSKTPEYTDPIRALRKWASNAEAQWRAARRARERDGAFVKPARPPEPADDAPTPGELRRLAEEFRLSQEAANAG